MGNTSSHTHEPLERGNFQRGKFGDVTNGVGFRKLWIFLSPVKNKTLVSLKENIILSFYQSCSLNVILMLMF